MTPKEEEQIVDVLGVLANQADQMLEALKILNGRIALLEARVRELEAS